MMSIRKRKNHIFRKVLCILLIFILLIVSIGVYQKLTSYQPEEIVYGQSGAGRDLLAYRYGEGENVAVLCFGIHGWEDGFDQDGELLYQTGKSLCRMLSREYSSLIEDRNWSVYVLPLLNPDGLYNGWSSDGPGRCTTHILDDNGNSVYGEGLGIDMNRCFPYRFEVEEDSRNYTGKAPLGTAEARALAEFVENVKGSDCNYLVDTHGWYNQIIVNTDTSGLLYNCFNASFSGNYASLESGCGYFSAWAAYEVGYDEACLFEFPPVSSARKFQTNGYQRKYCSAIRSLLEQGGNCTRVPPQSNETDPDNVVEAFAVQHGLHMSDYPAELLDMLERNPETESFVLNYPLEYGKSHEIDMTEYEGSEQVPLFMQWDPRWGYLDYGSSVVGLSGCGPICLAMAGAYVTGDYETFRPDKIVEFALDEGYRIPETGTSWSLISEGGELLGLDVTEIPLDEDRIIQNLEVGNPIICVVGPGVFTTQGHYIVLAGYEGGLFRVNDPNSHANSERLWSYDEIQDQIQNLWVIR